MEAWVWIVIVVAAVVILGAIAWLMWERRRRERLREHYGTEYQRLEEDEGARHAAAELRERERRRASYEIRPLTSDEHSRFVRAWEDVQAKFVDSPRIAVLEADRLVIEVMRVRGYPMDEFEQRAADLSVDHPRVVDNYRTAHGIAMRSEESEVDTEELRRATLAYRELFEELLEERASDYERTG